MVRFESGEPVIEALTGFLTDPFLHLHAVFARRDFSTIGGHVKELRVHPTLELWLRTEDVPVRRAHDAATGLDLLELPPA